MSDSRIKSQIGRVDGNFLRNLNPITTSLEVRFGGPARLCGEKKERDCG